MSTETEKRLTNNVVDSCVALLQAMHTVATPAICQMDVTMSQVKAMLTISMKSVASVGDIALVTGVGLPSTSATVDRLVSLGWVERAEDPSDRRRTLVKLSQEGTGVIETVWRLRRDLLRTWATRLDPKDLEKLAEGLAALNAASRTDDTVSAIAAAQ